MKNKIGELLPGSFADLIILDANPLADITVLDRHEKHLKCVVKDGYVFLSRLEEIGLKVYES